MDEQSAVRGQGFTLMVFGGLVALCSVFFILGMVVGRSQSIGPADDTAEPVAAAAPVEELDPELDFYEAVSQDDVSSVGATPQPPPLQPPPAPEPPALEPGPEPAPTVVGDEAILLQLGAFGTEATAEGVAADVRELDIAAFVLRPAGNSALYRVQVGPFTSAGEASRIRSELEAGGFDVISVR